MLACRNQDAALAHDTTHKSSSVTPPGRMRCNVSVEVPLTFVLDVKGEDMAREVLPSGTSLDAFVAMFEDVSNAVLKVVNGTGVFIPPLHVVLLHRSIGAVHCRKFVLLDVGVIAPAA